MANGWTPERRARQAEIIQRWQPWKNSSGPKTEEGKFQCSRNAYRGGKRNEMKVLLRQANDVLKKQRDFLAEFSVPK